MKSLTLFLALTLSSFAALADSSKDSTGWALLAGQSTLIDGRKMAEDTKPVGTSFKGTWASRSKYFETGFILRYATMKDDITFENVDGELKTNDVTVGIHGGFWPFSWIKVHGGYAVHFMRESVSGDFTATQKSDLEEEYRLHTNQVFGLFGGADLVLYQTKSFQFFTNYDFYYLNGSNAHQWEAMAGVRFYLSGKSSVGKGNFFVKMFRDLLKLDEK